MTQEFSLALETNTFFFDQTHQSGSVIVPETPLDVIRLSASSRNLDFYCQSNHVTIPLSSATDLILTDNSIKILCASMSCRVFIKCSEKQYQDQLIKIASNIQTMRSSAGSTSACSGTIPDKDHSKAASTRPPKPQKEFARESISQASPHNPNSNPKAQPNNRQSTSQQRKEEPPSLKMSHSRKDVQEIIKFASIAHTFQASYVLEKIVENEIERINKEKSAWKVAGAVAGLAMGLSDGFQFTDLFTSMAFSNIGGMAHEFASKEQVEFLKKVKSDWLISQKSFLEICHRLGMPRQRTVCYFADTGKVCIANIHENPSRGTFLVPMGAAKDHATGFKNDDSLSVLYNTFEEAEINILAYQLHPTELVELDSQKRISQSKAATLNPYHNLLEQFDQVSHLTLKTESSPIIAYKVPIPVGSEY